MGKMESSYHNLQDAWRSIVNEAPEDLFLQIPAIDGRITSYRLLSFYKRAAGLANGFRQELQLVEGEAIVILLNEPGELSLVLHAVWLARLTAVPLCLDLPSSQLVAAIQSVSARVVVFSTASSAKIAGLFSEVRSVEHWLVAGSASAGRRVDGVGNLDELSKRSFGDLADNLFETSDCSALILPSRRTPNYLRIFTQRQLLNGAAQAADLYPYSDDADELVWVGLEMLSLQGIEHNFLVPLLSSCPVVLNREIDIRRFWTQARSAGFTFVVLDQDDVRRICRRGRSRTWLRPERLGVLLVTSSVVSPALIKTFMERFKVPITTCYHIAEAAGIVTASDMVDGNAQFEEWLDEYEVASSGTPVSGAEVWIADSDGAETEEEMLGEVWVRSECGSALVIGSCVGESDVIKTGDEGFFARDNQGRKHFFIVGRRSELIHRDRTLIQPGSITNTLLGIRGVELGRVVGFPNMYVGQEVGAYVVPLRVANLTEEELLRRLSEKLDWEECPKMIIFGERSPDGGGLPGNDELIPLFEAGYTINFSR